MQMAGCTLKKEKRKKGIGIKREKKKQQKKSNSRYEQYLFKIKPIQIKYEEFTIISAYIIFVLPGV